MHVGPDPPSSPPDRDGGTSPSGRRRDRSDPASFMRPEVVAAALEPWVPDERDREFVVRVILDEGPAHHRGSSFVLLALLAELVRRRGARASSQGPVEPVRMHLPPHVASQVDGTYPLALPLEPLRALAPDDPSALRAMAECLVDGPAHHALANAACVALLGALLDPSAAP